MSRHASEEQSPPLSIPGPRGRLHPCLSIPPAGPSCSCLAWVLDCSCAQEELGAASHRGHSIAGLLSQQRLCAPSAELLFKPSVPEDGTLWMGKGEHPSWWVLPTPAPQEAQG